MNKRVVSALLWFYAGWTFGALVALALGLNSILGPIVGTVATILFVADPRRIIWTLGEPARSSSGTQPESI